MFIKKTNGLDTRRVGKKMGYKSKSTINKIELGINDIPQSKISQFANVLNTTPAYLMGWTEENKEAPTPEGYVSFLGRDGKNKIIKATPELIALLETLPGSDDDF